MPSLRYNGSHHNVAVVIFDCRAMHLDHVLRKIRAHFGAGILRSVPHHGTCPFTQADAQEVAATMFGPCQLDRQIKEDLARCKELGRRQDALLAAIRRESWVRRVEAIYGNIDETD
jgi:hypothetical protein